MNYRQFGKTDMFVSEIGFGAWAIGGPARVGNVPIGWGDSEDSISIKAIHKALDQGINFFDTADFYGLGHSEILLGKELKNQKDIFIASKAGHRVSDDYKIYTDYSGAYLIRACEASLKRLQKDTIDYFQLHTAKLTDLSQGDCQIAMHRLQEAGKIRYWGVSLNTFNPFPEGEFILKERIGDGLQLAFNLINQRALSLIRQAGERGFGIIARMPLQFGLLSGKFTPNTKFPPHDHRSFRLNENIIRESEKILQPVWRIAEKYQTTNSGFSLSYVISHPEISTVIPGIRTAD